MTLTDFIESTKRESPPDNISDYLLAMWYDRRDNWMAAHDIVQEIDSAMAARIHAYLHRVEGDQWNADYWYRRAGMSRPDSDLATEWESIVRSLLK